MPKAPRRKCTFNSEMQKEYPFLKKHAGMEDRVRCLQCLSEFSVSHGGRSDIKDHLKTTKHTGSLLAAAQSPRLDVFFKKTVPGETDFLIAAEEATFAYHSAVHNISFKTADCSSKLIAKLFEPKFSSARTKTEAIILNAIVPLAAEELKKDLSECQFVTITADASNRKEMKIVPVLVRYFLPEEGVKVKLIDFNSVPGETAEILTNTLMNTFKEHQLSEKIIAYCGDNCNTNFGGVKRKGKNNVFNRLKEELGRDIVGIGCGAHILHNSIQTAVDVLPIEVESLVVKIYKYFYIYTVRVTHLKEFCDLAEVEYKKLLQHGNTRFLSLLPAVDRILQIFEALKEYFTSQEHCPFLISNFFENRYGELYLRFVRGQLALFNKAILSIEKTNATACDIVAEIDTLKRNLRERRENNFVPTEAKKIINVLISEGDGQLMMIRRKFSNFYDCCISYIELWENSFGGGESFIWTRKKVFEWSDIEASAEKINEKIGKSLINIDDLFDEVVYAKGFWLSKSDEWKEQDTENKWVELFKYFKNEHISVPNLRHVIEYIFCLPGTSAPAERVFSLMNNIWSQERGLLKETTVKGLLICKTNIGLSCTDFFEKIKTNKSFLKKVHSSEKYECAKNLFG